MPPRNRQDIELQNRLDLIKELLTQDRYDFSHHVQTYLIEDAFETTDLVQCILSATNIHKVEPDRQGSMDGNKYTIYGRDTWGEPFYTCGKIILVDNQRVYFFITAHRRD